MTKANTDPITDPATVAQVQSDLRKLGYVNAGPVDGDLTPGGKTEGAILELRNSLNVNGNTNLPLKPVIDAALIKAMKTAPPKEVPVEQSNATEAEIAPKIEAVNQNLWAKLKAKVATWSSLVVALIIGIINNLGDAINALTPLKTFLSEWLDGVDKLTLITVAAGVTALVSGVLWLNTRQTGAAMAGSYQGGTLGDDNKEAAANGAAP